LSRILGVTEPVAGDWHLTTIGWIFSIAIIFLGLSAAVFGQWLERAGPRKAMFVSALCFSSGFFLSALGVYLHNIWLVYLGYGVFGGIGLGIGYISPVSTLIKWFPDRPGMATGLAIMGFGGGAMLGSPLGVALMKHFSSATSVGVWEAFLVMGVLYLMLMMVGVLSQASPMIQEMFPGRVTVEFAAMFVVLLSFFNLAGRFLWSSFSDKIGRKTVYGIYFGLGIILYSLIPTLGGLGSPILFVAAFAIIMTMYGGGFATIPAYLRDLFGTFQVGAIHGRLLTAWSTAGILGPVLVNYIREAQLNAGIPAAQAYTITMYIMASLLLIGFICNLAVREVDARHHRDMGAS
jgi:MFS family permease